MTAILFGHLFEIILTEQIVTTKVWKSFSNRIPWCYVRYFQILQCFAGNLSRPNNLVRQKSVPWKTDETVSESEIVSRKAADNTVRKTWKLEDLDESIKTGRTLFVCFCCFFLNIYFNTVLVETERFSGLFMILVKLYGKLKTAPLSLRKRLLLGISLIAESAKSLVTLIWH